MKFYLQRWISELKHSQNMEDTATPASFAEASTGENKQNAFTTAESSIQNIVDIVQHHSHNCPSGLKLKKLVYRGHVAVVTFHCGNQINPHILKWSSSPYLPNKEYLVNHRVVHGFTCSGMLPIHCKRFCKGTQISETKEENRDKIPLSCDKCIQRVCRARPA